MLSFNTTGFSGTGVAYSPFLDSRLTVSASANFGLVGNGRLYILDITPDGTIVPVKSFDTQDSQCGVAWSETHENQLVTAGGDGTVRLFDVTTPQPFPIQVFKEHTQEVFSVNWSLTDKVTFCSASWDGTIKVWNPARAQSIITLGLQQAHIQSQHTVPGAPGTPSTDKRCVYQAKYAPSNPSQILAAYADASARIWDIRAGNPAMTIPAVLGGDCLTADWNKYQPNVIATAGVDKAVKIWDLRNLSVPVNDLRGHQYAVRSVKWSPHSPTHLLSVSYDMTAKVWVDNRDRHVPATGPRGLVSSFDRHTEFLSDCDWSLWGQPGWVATVGWDQMVYLWKAV